MQRSVNMNAIDSNNNNGYHNRLSTFYFIFHSLSLKLFLLFVWRMADAFTSEYNLKKVKYAHWLLRNAITRCEYIPNRFWDPKAYSHMDQTDTGQWAVPDIGHIGETKSSCKINIIIQTLKSAKRFFPAKISCLINSVSSLALIHSLAK